MAKPLYYRSSNPGLSNVTAKSNKLFEWDGTGSMPAEIANGKAFMPPAPVSGEYAIWADSYTLGYTNEADAAPIFFSDGGAGDAKILKMINSVANRLGVSKFSDIAAAKAWASSSPLINIGGGSTGGSTPITAARIRTSLFGHYDRIPSTSQITANGQIRFNASSADNAGIIQITRYTKQTPEGYGPYDKAYYLENVIADKVVGTGSGSGTISFGFNAEMNRSGSYNESNGTIMSYNGTSMIGAELVNIVNTYGYTPDWAMTWSAFDTSTFPSNSPYYNVANPTLKTINGIEVYEFIGAMDTGYTTSNSADPTTVEPIWISPVFDDTIVSHTYYLNPMIQGGGTAGSVLYGNGYSMFNHGSSSTNWFVNGQPSTLTLARYDANGVDLYAYSSLSQNAYVANFDLKIERDASNYVIVNVSMTQDSTYSYANGNGDVRSFNVNSVIESVGSRPALAAHEVDPGYITVTKVNI